MIVGIEFLRFSNMHNGGKCQVAYNLLKGFYENGRVDSIVCFCHEELKEMLLEIAPNVKIVIVTKFERKGIIPYKIKEGRCLGKLIKEHGIDIMFFTDKFPPVVKTECLSILLSHDILAFIASENRKIVYHKKLIFLEKLRIKVDFFLRDYIIAISNYDKNCMHKYLSKSINIKRIYNPIVFSDYQEEAEKKYITALNIQHPHKNVMTLVKAFYEVKDLITHDLILVGKEPRNIKEIREYIISHNLENRIILTGFVSEDDLKAIISKTRLYVNPSLFEGFGMTSVEMMGSRIPIICADNSAQKEVTCGKGKYYSPAEDAQALAQIILEEIKQPTEKKLLNEYANIVKEKYDYRIIAAEYWDFFVYCYNQSKIHI